MCLWGEALIAKYRDAGTVVQLGLLPPDAVAVEIVDDGVFDWADLNGTGHRLTRDDVIHAFGMSLDSRGLSPVGSVREGLGLNRALARYGSSTYRNRGPAGRRLEGPGRSTGRRRPDQQLRRGLRGPARGRGGKNAGKVAVVSGDIDFTQVTMSVSDAEWIAAKELSTREVARIFSVPPSLIAGESGGWMTYSTVALEMQALQQRASARRSNYVAAALSADPDLCGPQEYVDFSYEGLLRADQNTRAQFYSSGLSGGSLTPNEVRTWEDLEPLPGGDVPRPASTRTPRRSPMQVPDRPRPGGVEDRNRPSTGDVEQRSAADASRPSTGGACVASSRTTCRAGTSAASASR